MLIYNRISTWMASSKQRFKYVTFRTGRVMLLATDVLW